MVNKQDSYWMECTLDEKVDQDTMVSGSAPCKGLKIMQVEILSGKELTTPPEMSFELLVVTLAAKRKQ